MSNPFYYGGHVAPEQFVGRRAELQRVFAALETTHTGQMQSVAVVGPRRIGKSSLLFYLAQVFSTHLNQATRYRFAYIDLQSADCKTTDGLLRKILNELHANTKGDRHITLTRFQDAILQLRRDELLPVVCLDELEELIEKPDEFTSDLYDSWRYLINENSIGFVTASKAPLNELAATQQYTSPFFNIFIHLPLGNLTVDEAEELSNRGYTCDRPFTRAERDLVYFLGQCHPYKLQLAGDLVYQAKGEEKTADPDWVRHEYTRQIRAVGLERPLFPQDWPGLAKRLLLALLTSPKILGRTFLEGILRLERDKISETTTLMIGYIILVLVFLLVIRIIGFEQILDTFDRLRGTGKPDQSP